MLNFYSWFPGVGRLKSRVLRQCCATEDHSRWEMVAMKRTVQLREMGLYLQHRLCL